MQTLTGKTICSFLICLLYSFTAFAIDHVDEFVQQQMKKKQIPGVALLVIQQGTTVKEQGYGFANIELEVPVRPETIFQSGSVGKQFTATAIMMLMEQGKLKLDDPISKYLKVPGRWKGITIRHMLTHTSGLGDYPDDFNFRKDYTEDELLPIVAKTPLKTPPGEKWAYSNLAYLTLGVLIHKVSGQFYGDFLRDHVWKPIGMDSTRIISEADIVPNRADGYQLENQKIKNQEWIAPMINTTADGSMYFNIVDLAKWDAALYTDRLIKKESLDQMWTPVKLNNGSTYPYGFGWRVDQVNGHRRIEHGGAWQGFTTQISRYVDDRLTVIVLTNLEGANPEFIAHSVAGLYLPAVALPKHTAISLPPEVLQSYSGKYQVEKGSIVTVSADANQVKAKWSETVYELLPESETSFFQEDSETTVTFKKDEQGKVTGLIWHSEPDLELKKIN